ncbi:cysteine--tRNA ligase, cytoplasmic [Prorops nasuta]|uniref:cysteine--tRNA ligase, cytoplasmic n=1 Tax=Prorops nasuta TaxID=863751 RepID=UPI0034CDAD47
MAKRQQPEWSPPQNNSISQLKLYNSLTRSKDLFVPLNGNRVLWYSCGPTVYDASHMGHARSYISFDIMRRVLSNYFGYNILYVMNITDIDDKIIKRARQNYLYDKYLNESNGLQEVLLDVKNAITAFENKIYSTKDQDKKTMSSLILSAVQTTIQDLEEAVKLKDETKIKQFQGELIEKSRDILADWLDRKYGAEITEHSIFSKLSQHWENDFHKDMDALNVLRPNVLTRVSEYIPEIVAYIEQIIKNGLAYESNGSIYFDVGKFDKQDKHYYAKLVPEAYGDTSSLEEGEGDLSTTDEILSEKRSPNDFALWKNSKAGEPWWESPWGKGRPGWHIECSVMASTVCGDHLDIHTGGIDLKFPHHDNELAQAEAYFDHSHWVRYFLHSGHLTISGCKMSKSLKNFITIKEALKKHSARQLRLAFLLHSWKDTLDYSQNTMNMAIQYEKFLNEFFLNVKCKLRSLGTGTTINTFSKWKGDEQNLSSRLIIAQDAVHTALCDNIDTRKAMDAIRDLLSYCNVYMKKSAANILLLRDVAVFVTKILDVFGLVTSTEEIGFPVDHENSNTNVEEIVMPYLEILSNFREKIRDQAKELKADSILQECDILRDDILPNVGVRLEDSTGQSCSVKLVNREELLKEREIKRKLEVEKAAEKEKRKAEAAALLAAKEAQRKIPPSQMFTSETDKYSQFDDKGLPTHDIAGKEISKGQLKKLQKLQQQQEKRYNEYLESVQNGA